MPNYDERTSRGWPLPFNSNTLEFDVERLRETLNLIDEALGGIEQETKGIVDEKLAGIEERQYILDARMDVIAGQTTEDSEILDARVDAKGTTHPNLGHNVRNLHSKVIELNETVMYWLQEYGGMLRQFNELAYAQIQGELNSLSAHERRKEEIRQTNERIDDEANKRSDADAQIREEISQEALTRDEHDGILQGQIQELSETSVQGSLNLLHEAEQRRRTADDLKAETDARKGLEREVGECLSELNEALNDEETARINSDNELRQSLNDETEHRHEEISEVKKDLASEAETREKRYEDLRQRLNAEEVERRSDDSAQQLQTDANAEANILNALNIREEAEKRRKGLHEVSETLNTEIHTREEHDENLRLRVSAVDEKLNREEASRIEADKDLRRRLDDEEFLRRSDDTAQQLQINETAEAVTYNALSLHNEAESRRKDIKQVYEALRSENLTRENADIQERFERAENDEALRMQTDTLAETDIQHSLNLHAEAEHRRKAVQEVNAALTSESQIREEHDEQLGFRLSAVNEELSREKFSRIETDRELHRRLNDEETARRSDDAAQQKQIDANAEANIRNALNLHSEIERRNAVSAEEKSERISGDEALHTEADILSHASIQHSLNLHAEAEHRRKAVQEVNAAVASEAEIREEHDEDLRSEINAEKSSRLQADDELHQRLNAEEIARRSDDGAQQLQIDETANAVIENALNLRNEAEHRRHVNDALNAEIQQRTEHDARQDEEISGLLRELSNESQERIGNEKALQFQADANAEANINNALNLKDANEQRKADLAHEEAERISGDETLQSETDVLSHASILQSLNLHNEAEQRRKGFNAEAQIREENDEILRQRLSGLDDALSREKSSRINTDDEIQQRLNDEEAVRRSDDTAQQLQTDANSEANIRNSLSLIKANEKHKADLACEETERISADRDLQTETDELSNASLRHSLILHYEAERRRKGLHDVNEALSKEISSRSQNESELWQGLNGEEMLRRSDDSAQEEQIHLLALAEIRNALSSKNAHDRRKAEILQEILTRSEDDKRIQDQINELAFAVITTALHDCNARQRLKEYVDRLYQAVADTGNLTYMGAGIASRNEVSEMLKDVLTGSDDGEVRGAEIPEALHDRIATSSEISEMLGETFPNYNRS